MRSSCGFGFQADEKVFRLKPGLPAQDPIASLILRFSKRPNWFWNGKTLTTWKWDRFFEEEGCLVLESHSLSLSAAFFSLSDLEGDLSWGLFRSLPSVLLELLVKDQLPKRPIPTLLFTDRLGNWLGFDPDFSFELGKLLPERASSKWNPNHEKRIWPAWTAALVWDTLSGGQWKKEFWHGGRMTTELALPGLKQKLSEFLDLSLSNNPTTDLGQWERLTEELGDDLWDDLTLLRKKEIEDRRQDFLQKMRVKQFGREFFQRHKKPIFILLAVLAAITVISLPDLLAYRRANQEELVLSDPDYILQYYDAMNTLNASILREMTDSSLVRDDFYLAAQLHVFQNVREVTLGTKGLLRLTEWKSQGFPALPSGLSVYGVTELELTELGAFTWEVIYLRVAGRVTSETTSEPEMEIVKDLVRIEETNGRRRLNFLKRTAEKLQ